LAGYWPRRKVQADGRHEEGSAQAYALSRTNLSGRNRTISYSVTYDKLPTEDAGQQPLFPTKGVVGRSSLMGGPHSRNWMATKHRDPWTIRTAQWLGHESRTTTQKYWSRRRRRRCSWRRWGCCF